MADNDNELLTIDYVANEVLHCSRYTVRRMIDSGHLPAVRIGKRMIRIRRSDLERAITPVEVSR